MGTRKPETVKKQNDKHIADFRAVHGTKYEYLEFKIVKQQSQVLIHCNRCGNEWWSSTNNHKRNHGCALCALEDSNMTIKEIEKKAQKKHDVKYQYIKVFKNEKGFKQLLLSCSIHGEFTTGMMGHMRGQGLCPTCESERRKAGLKRDGTKNKAVHPYTFEEAIEKAQQIHGTKYKYKSIYKDHESNSVLVMDCPVHGEVHQRVRYHIGERNGCYKCAKMKGAYTRKHAERYKAQWLTEKSYNYTLLCFDEEEMFYKIGISCKGVSLRYRGVLNMPYRYKILEEQETNRYESVCKENDLKELYAPYSYSPKKKFAGYTECFSKITHLDLNTIDINSLKTYNE